VLRFIENQLGLSPLTERDGKATDIGNSLGKQELVQPYLMSAPLR
jgi:hypothetical protein